MRIITDSLTKRINTHTVLNNINLQFEGGNIYGIVGQNGSGKTMLLRAISGLIRPTSGYVSVDDKKLFANISFPPNMGLIIEKPEFLPYLSGFENLKLLAEIRGIVSDHAIRKHMDVFMLDPNSKQKTKKYSLGMKQKVGIIQAIMENPDFLILDEPFNALDAESVGILREILIDFRTQGKLVIITSHHQDDIDSICNQVIHLENGNQVPITR